MDTVTKNETEKPHSLTSRLLSFIVLIWILAMLFIFLAIFLFIDYLSFITLDELKAINGIVNPPTQLIINVDANGFLDYFLRYQLITIIVGIVAFITAFKLITFLISHYISPLFKDIKERRREAWREYLNGGFTYENLTEEQLKGLNLRRKALDFDVYMLVTILMGFFFVFWLIMLFLEIDNLGDPDNNMVTIVLMGFVLIGLLIFIEIGRKLNRPIFKMERKIKTDLEWKEILEELDKQKETEKTT